MIGEAATILTWGCGKTPICACDYVDSCRNFQASRLFATIQSPTFVLSGFRRGSRGHFPSALERSLRETPAGRLSPPPLLLSEHSGAGVDPCECRSTDCGGLPGHFGYAHLPVLPGPPRPAVPLDVSGIWAIHRGLRGNASGGSGYRVASHLCFSGGGKDLHRGCVRHHGGDPSFYRAGCSEAHSKGEGCGARESRIASQ